MQLHQGPQFINNKLKPENAGLQKTMNYFFSILHDRAYYRFSIQKRDLIF